MQSHMGMLVHVLAAQPRAQVGHANAEFLVQLATQGLRRRFAGLDLAAGKLPVAGIHRVLRALTKQVAPVRPQQHTRGHIDELACHALSSSSRPAWSRANCQATRPEREPRISAHCSASWRAAKISSALAPKLRSQCATMSRYSSWLKG